MPDTTTTLPAEIRAELAELAVLELYNRRRFLEYGDMARSRRGRELDRRARKLIHAGVHVDRDGNLPESTPDELRAAFERVGRPRYRRVMNESYRHGTLYTRATLGTWRLVAAELGVELER